MESPNSPHFDTIYPLLPSGLKAGIDDLLSRTPRKSIARHTLDQFLRFCSGRSVAEHDPDSSEEWHSQRAKVIIALSNLSGDNEIKSKRALEDPVDGLKSKKTRLDLNEPGAVDDHPLYTLNSLSVVSPIRKKVNIAIHRRAVRFVNGTSGVQEASVQLGSITRAFLVPTAGKSKPHWTVIMLTSVDQTQIIFGIDAIAPSLETILASRPPQMHPKGTETKSFLQHFLSHLPSHIPVHEPSTSVFRSASGEPFVDAYLRAKEGHVLFFNDGLLFGEKKPCLWIPLKEIKSIRTLSATGRSFSIFVTRVPGEAQVDHENSEEEEIEFSLVDGKNQDVVNQWIRDNRDKLGREVVDNIEAVSKAEESDEQQVGDEVIQSKKNGGNLSDEDSDYESDSESDGGSPSYESLSGDDDQGDDGQDRRNEELECDDNADGEEEDSLNPNERSPFISCGVPRTSTTTIDAMINIVKDDLMGSGEADELEDEEVDELE